MHIPNSTRCLIIGINVQFLYGTLSIASISRKEKKMKRDAKLKEFLMKTSALRNSGGGCMLVQLVGLEPGDHFIGAFDEFADEKLCSLIEDGSFFDDVFKKIRLSHLGHGNQYSDMVVIDIRPSKQMITLDVKTKVSLDGCIITCSRHSLSCLIHERRGITGAFPERVDEGALMSLHESRRIQLKCDILQGKSDMGVDEFVDALFDRYRLHEYVSAFSKLPEGGMFFLGIGEKQRYQKHYVSREVDVHGITLINSSILRVKIQTKLKKEILVCDYDGREIETDLVEVFIIPIDTLEENRFVLQISVRAVDGVVFCDASGPLAYKVNNEDGVERIPLREWFENQFSSSKRKQASKVTLTRASQTEISLRNTKETQTPSNLTCVSEKGSTKKDPFCYDQTYAPDNVY